MQCISFLFRITLNSIFNQKQSIGEWKTTTQSHRNSFCTKKKIKTRFSARQTIETRELPKFERNFDAHANTWIFISTVCREQEMRIDKENISNKKLNECDVKCVKEKQQKWQRLNTGHTIVGIHKVKDTKIFVWNVTSDSCLPYIRVHIWQREKSHYKIASVSQHLTHSA